MKRYFVMCLSLLLVGTVALVCFAQRPSPSPSPSPSASPANEEEGRSEKFDPTLPLQPIERFDGRAALKNPKLLSAGQGQVQMTLRNWSIPNRQRIDKFPEQGFLIVQVRSGEDMYTVIDGQRQKRALDEFFTVPSGSTLSIETGNDTVVLQTMAIKPAK